MFSDDYIDLDKEQQANGLNPQFGFTKDTYFPLKVTHEDYFFKTIPYKREQEYKDFTNVKYSVNNI